MERGKFSVLMSVYHKETAVFLERALKSNLEEQTLLPAQFVLVCDGSLTEELDLVIDSYVQKYPEVLKVCRLPENGGLGKALNYGLQHCDYELVARADSDDICEPHRFERQVAYMEEHPKVSASSGSIAEFITAPDELQRERCVPLTHAEILRYARNRSPLNHAAVMFRKGDILEVGSYQHLHGMEDYFLWVRLLADDKKLGNLDEVLVYVCVGNGMECRRKDKRLIESWTILSRFMYSRKLVSLWQHWLNLTKIRVWCMMPSIVRHVVYRGFLRRKCRVL